MDGRTFPSDVSWDDLPDGDILLKIGSFNLCTLQVIRADMRTHEDDPIVSPTQPWNCEEVDPEFGYLQDAHRAGFFHVAEYVCQDEEPRHTAKVLLIIQQDGTSEWIRNANLDRLGSIPTFQHQDNSMHFFKVNRDACQSLLGVNVVTAIQGSYDPFNPNKWILLAGGQELRWCKVCQVPRSVSRHGSAMICLNSNAMSP